jgi:UDP-N-acetylmuramoyl-L-alanyl-D-glutamate--2,6-diaminopimelate ligase
MMKLRVLLEPWIAIPSDAEVTGIQQDSRAVKHGDVFLAYPGLVADGRLFLSQAVEAGASAIVYEPMNCPESVVFPDELPCIALSNLAELQGLIASRFYGHPTRAFSVTGVTGTNGKTTIAYQLAQAHDLLGKRAAYLGTLGQGSVNALEETHNTTPDPLSLQRFFHTAKQDGVLALCMEVSSHALAQSRVAGVDFTQAIFTNLTHEHLDYHQTMQAYAEAKTKLFAMPTLQWAIINQDDDYALFMKESVPQTCKILTYGLGQGCDVRAEQITMNISGTTFDVETPWGRFSLAVKAVGTFNVYNSLAVFASLLAAGYDPQAVVQVMSILRPSPGRMEIISVMPTVIVDYAHTPDALENVLSTVDQLSPRKIIVVFGCGGDRDKTKRPLMGEVASRYADQIILTSDNPRTEDPLAIIQEIAQGIPASSEVSIIEDRTTAIHQALHTAHPDDLILIAGKGHENYQQIGLKRLPFSDEAVVRAYTAGH